MKLNRQQVCRALGICQRTLSTRISEGVIVPLQTAKRTPQLFCERAIRALAAGRPAPARGVVSVRELKAA